LLHGGRAQLDLGQVLQQIGLGAADLGGVDQGEELALANRVDDGLVHVTAGSAGVCFSVCWSPA
jgi:hypothetical protein